MQSTRSVLPRASSSTSSFLMDAYATLKSESDDRIIIDSSESSTLNRPFGVRNESWLSVTNEAADPLALFTRPLRVSRHSCARARPLVPCASTSSSLGTKSSSGGKNSEIRCSDSPSRTSTSLNSIATSSLAMPAITTCAAIESGTSNPCVSSSSSCSKRKLLPSTVQRPQWCPCTETFFISTARP
eukprot:Amastigsp_a175465_24.p2 type:complete len:186 gc:universal Amastigsp_a175465_24:759-1316(+)